MAKETTSSSIADGVYNAMLREYYGDDLMRDLASRQTPFVKLEPPTRKERVLRALRIVRWRVRAPFRWIAYGFAWLGGLSPRDEWD